MPRFGFGWEVVGGVRMVRVRRARVVLLDLA
jgi:hypothetical protein